LGNDKIIDFKLESAAAFLSKGKFLHAIQIYTSVLIENPDIIEANFSLAEIYIQSGNVDQAINLLKDLLGRNPENQDVRLFTGQILLRNAKWHEATEILSYILPEEKPIVSFFLGYSYFMLNEYKLAQINFNNYLKHKTENELLYEAYLFLGKIEIEFENFETALKFLKKTEPFYSNYWELHYYSAKCFYNLDMQIHAILSVEKAIKLNPKEYQSYELSGKIYLKNGDYLKAEKNFLKYIELNQNISSEIYVELGETYLKIKNAKDALGYFELALKIDPKNNEANEGKIAASRIIHNSTINNA
jgi:tetratricopeptide (TPR) repeat protein